MVNSQIGLRTVQDIMKENIFFRTSEHGLMYEKARVFGDGQSILEILHAESPAEAKKSGVRCFPSRKKYGNGIVMLFYMNKFTTSFISRLA